MYKNIYNNTIQNSPKPRTTHMLMNMDSIILGIKYYTALRLNKQELHITVWMEFTNIVLSKNSRHRNSYDSLHNFQRKGKTNLCQKSA